jgi:PKD repeat protein
VGDHVVKVTKDDYKPAEMTVKVLPDDTVPADFTLEPIATTGFIHVTSTPSGAEIFIDGMDTGMVTEATIDAMPPGDYLVKVTLDDYQDAEQIVTVAAGETVDVDFQLVEAPLPPKAQFLAFPRQGTAPLTVLFIDLSQGDPTSRLWDFGDGTTSTEPFPLHTYGAAGKYTVTLTVTNGGGSDTVKRENYITVKAANPPKAQFLAYPRQGTAPMTVLFLDLSLGSPTSRLWDFGDGTKSTEPFPLHTYSAPGKYTVTLTVTNGGGSDTLVRHNFIIVRAANPPRAQFTAYPQDGEAPLAVTFLDLSWGYPTSRVWDFGDGTGSTEINPVHVYEKPGKYTVTLTVTNDAGSDTAIHKNFIKVSEKKHRMKGTGESEEGSGDTGLPQVPVSTPVPVTTQRPQIKIG